MSVGPSVIAFARRTFRPFSSRVFDTLGALGLFGLPLVLGVRSSWTAAALVLLALLVILLGRAGLEVEGERLARARPAMRLDLAIENLDGQLDAGGGAVIGERAAFWARITNLGPPAEFTARVDQMTNAVRAQTRASLADYSVDRVAWMDIADGRMPLARDEVSTLRLLERGVLGVPRGLATWLVFYFFTAANPDGHGRGWVLEFDDPERPVEFRLTVTNVDADVAASWRLAFRYDERTHQVLQVVASPDAPPPGQ